MLDWPKLDELKQRLDVASEDWDGDLDETRLTRLLGAAIAKVKLDVGDWDEYVDVPDEQLAEAVLVMCELIARKPNALTDGVNDPTYNRLLHGHRRSFGIA